MFYYRLFPGRIVLGALGTRVAKGRGKTELGDLEVRKLRVLAVGKAPD
jgi:hypothetical protein